MKRFLKRAVLVLLGAIAAGTLLLAVLFALVNETNGEIVAAGERRRYLLYVPESHDPTTPAPLVISIHGFAEWPAHLMRTSGWNALAEAHGFIVVYPAGTGFPLRWRAGEPAGGALDDQPADVAFIADLIDTLAADYAIDPRRIYADGFSNGGGMAHLLACELADRIAAVGGVAGACVPPWEACRAERPVPAILFHGTADRIVPYEGSAGGAHGFVLPPIGDWTAERAAVNGCNPEPVRLPPVGEVTGLRYEECDQGAEVLLYTIEGGGHSWPGGEPLPRWIVGRTTADIEATTLIWEFFVAHPLPE